MNDGTETGRICIYNVKIYEKLRILGRTKNQTNCEEERKFRYEQGLE